MRAAITVRHSVVALLFIAATASAQTPQTPQGGRGGPQPESVREASQFIREGKMEDALKVYEKALASTPDSVPVNNAAGVLLDLMGRTTEARRHFQKAIDAAPDAATKAAQQRAMAMSYAFDGNCAGTVKYEQMVFDYWVGMKDFYQQGEMANEAARVCIDAGDLDTAEKWYRMGREAGLREPAIAPGRKALWEFRTEHALARLAARRGNKAETAKHAAAAQAALDAIQSADANLYQQQAPFLPYLNGYTAYYLGDYKGALDHLLKANQADAFIQCLIGMTYEKLGDQAKAREAYQKASAVTSHNPPAAFAKPFTRKKLG
jgi:tetratricopeptide (TPR) repeat protein